MGTAEKVVKWMRRKPMHAAAAGLAILFLLTLGIGGPITALEQTRLREQAEAAARSLRFQAYSGDIKCGSERP